jgi:menaquinone-dependent protoporphyrinogen oxidase
MSRKILIIYGTHYGSTEEIAEFIATKLKSKNMVVDIINSKEDNNPSLTDYNAIIIGSGIRINRWTKETVQFIKNNLSVLKQQRNLAFFISCGFASDSETLHEAEEQYITKFLSKFGLTTDNYFFEAFGGKIDLTQQSRIGKFDKIIMWLYSFFKRGITIQNKHVNDYRDWKKVESFVDSISNALEDE